MPIKRKRNSWLNAMDFKSAEHKICSDMIINSDTWVMNTFWRKNARNFAAREIDKWWKRTMPLPYVTLFCCLGLFLIPWSCGEKNHHHRITDQDLLLFRSLHSFKQSKVSRRNTMLPRPTHLLNKTPVTDFWAPVVLKWRSIRFCTTLLQHILCSGCFFFPTHHRAEPKRRPENAPQFS